MRDWFLADDLESAYSNANQMNKDRCMEGALSLNSILALEYLVHRHDNEAHSIHLEVGRNSKPPSQDK